MRNLAGPRPLTKSFMMRTWVCRLNPVNLVLYASNNMLIVCKCYFSYFEEETRLPSSYLSDESLSDVDTLYGEHRQKINSQVPSFCCLICCYFF